MSWAQRVGRDDTLPRKATLQVRNVPAMLRAVEAGIGIADLPDYMASAVPNLVRVLPEHTGPTFDLFFIYPSDLKRSKRIAVFRDFLTAEVEAIKRDNLQLRAS